MSLLFNNWLDDGYYEKDDYDTFTRITDPVEIHRAQKEGTLYENDGMLTTKVNKDDEIIINNDNSKKTHAKR
jgi:hypothetical protein